MPTRQEHAAYMRKWRAIRRTIRNEARWQAWLEEHETMEFLLFCCEAGIEPSPQSSLLPRRTLRLALGTKRRKPYESRSEFLGNYEPRDFMGRELNAS